ncbi:tRNA (adenine(58)-N(1))-methyltransferase non-catalytic subunit Trm6 [Malassezia pachydermatis]|uniref:tRNA (adenine(58)-N(1))-methyltransferase non-catalytic subunit TRM6 n=1 Tax=Malassezia pachydermatis TaxID=77020 RepID=A0A0M8MN59_9BASI|nr:gcd10p-domain-containing protein [Malassezia pachydermatis]KOS13467.1 gcd10p-domain-containing protein [Malassezia pachydermatis]
MAEAGTIAPVPGDSSSTPQVHKSDYTENPPSETKVEEAPRKKTKYGQPPVLDNVKLRARTTFVPAGLQAFLRLPSGMVKQVTLERGKTVSIGKFGSFQADEIIGRPFGPTYEIKQDGSLEVMNQDVAEALVESEATNENIFDDGESQSLSYEDIKALKESGASGREIIQKQLEGNKSYELRTAYSQEKIMKRKESKHLKFFTPLPPDLFTVATYNFERSPEKVRGMRADALAQCLSFSNIQAGGKYLVVDNIGGLLVGAVLERMGGSGSVHLIHDADSPPALELMPHYNLTESHVQGVLRTMHWAATESRWTLPSHMAEELARVYATEREKNRARKKRAGIEDFLATRQQFFDGEFDSLIIASPYESYSMIHRLLPYLAGSANVVVHSPHLQPLVEVQARLRANPAFINVSITEPWLRRYQVLPARTHPDMTTSASGGYLLHAIRILDSDEDFSSST